MDSSTNNHIETSTNTRDCILTVLLKDAMRMARYAVEVGKLPENVKFAELSRMWDIQVVESQNLSTEDVHLLENYYRELEDALHPVTAVSLFATDIKVGSRKIKDYMSSEASKHARMLWLMAFLILTLVLSINLFQYVFYMQSHDWAASLGPDFVYVTVLFWFVNGITPFAYGAFGACVRLLRVTEQRLRDRSFDPRRIPEHRNRLVLGTLSGGVIVLLYSSGGIGDTGVKLTEAALGFIAGYSIDVLFTIIDRLVRAITPDNETEKSPQRQKKESEKQPPLISKNPDSTEFLNVESPPPPPTTSITSVIDNDKQKSKAG